MHTFAFLIPLLGFSLAHEHEHEYKEKYKPKCTRSTIIETVTASYPPTCTACYDAIDDCGQTYGGCWDACKTPGVPSFSRPDRTPTSSDNGPAATSSYDNECTRTVCVDKVNECGKKYGGCYNLCLTPTFTKPSCPTTDTPIFTPTPIESCTATICADYINDCGMMYGGCYNECDSPTFSPPPCPSTTTSKSYSAPETTSIEPCPTICVDNVNACGEWYGGCYPECETRNFTEPPCSITSSSSTAHPTKSYGYY